MTIYYEKPNGRVIALNINAISEAELPDNLPIRPTALYYRNETEWVFVSACGHYVIGPNGKRKWEERYREYTYCVPLPDQSYGEFYDDITEINTP